MQKQGDCFIFTTKTQSFRRSFSEGAKFFLKDRRVKVTKVFFLKFTEVPSIPKDHTD